MNFCSDLSNLALDPHGGAPLLDVALQIARDEYPNLDTDGYKAEIKMLARDCQIPKGKGLELKLDAFIRHFTHVLGFQGNTRDYYNPANSFLNQVVDRRLGIPISLGVLAISMGETLGLRFFGIGLPGHFINLACEGDQFIYFDLFHGGRILQPDDCEILSQEATGSEIKLERRHLLPLSTSQIIIRMLTNLRMIYSKKEDLRRSIRTLERLAQILPNEASYHLELGTKHLLFRQPTRALKHLEKYLSMNPNAMESAEFKSTLRQARQDDSLRN